MRPWLFWTLGALVSWGLWAVMAKLLGNSLTAEQSQALSTIGFLPILLPLALSRGSQLRNVSPTGLLLALLGGIISCLGNIPYYAAAARGEKFATVVSLAAMAPLVTVLLAVSILRERLNRWQLAGLGLATIAIWLFNVTEGPELFSPTLLVVLLPITLWGISGFLQKAATNHISGETSALVYLGAFLPMGVYYSVSQPWPNSLSLTNWMVVIALGFFLAFGNFAVLAAFARGGKAAVIAPLVNLFPVVSIGIALLLLGEQVGNREVLGIVFALAAVAALSKESTPSIPPTVSAHDGGAVVD